VADVAFKNNTFNGKVEGKKVMSFGKTKDAFATLAQAQPGTTYEVTIEKNDKGYNDWVSMQTANVSATGVQAPGPSGVQRGSGAVSASPRSNFETPEERAKRQVLIVRQSSIASAVAALSVGAKSALKAEDIKVLAKDFEKFIFDNNNATGFDDIPNFPPELEPNVE
jgi:hypothetical protein